MRRKLKRPGNESRSGPRAQASAENRCRHGVRAHAQWMAAIGTMPRRPLEPTNRVGRKAAKAAHPAQLLTDRTRVVSKTPSRDGCRRVARTDLQPSEHRAQTNAHKCLPRPAFAGRQARGKKRKKRVEFGIRNEAEKHFCGH